MAISPMTTSELMTLTRPGLPARETQKSWVGLTIAFGSDAGRLPLVPNLRKPAAVNAFPDPAKSKTFSSPAYRKPAPSRIRSAASPFPLFIMCSFRSSPMRRFGCPEPVVELDVIVGVGSPVGTVPPVTKGHAKRPASGCRDAHANGPPA